MDLQALITCAIAGALSWLMLAAGTAKLRRLKDHARVVDAYALLPAGAGRWVSPLMGVAECAAGAGIWPDTTHVIAAELMFALLALYSAAIAINLLRGHRDIDCGCGGPAAHVPLSGWLLARNAVLLGAALAVCAAPHALAYAAGSLSAAMASLALATLLVLLYNGANFLLARDALLQDD